MCRIAAYLGPPLPLAALTHRPAHSLLVQSYRPREMREAVLNADGVGAAWYPDDGDARPCRYRAATPVWSDENLAQLAPRTRSRALLAVVRSATPGLEVGAANTPPYIAGTLAFAHNGYLEPFRARLMRPLREMLDDLSYARVVGGTDSEHLFALLTQEAGDAPDAERLAQALQRVVETCDRLARDHGGKAILNIVVTNGEAIVACRHSSSGPTASFYSAVNPEGYEGGTVLASEPLTDAAAWRAVPEGVLLVVTRGGSLEHWSLG